MASTDWIKMRCNLGTDPDVIAMAAKLDLDEFAVVGRLHAVWSWLDAHSDDGKNVPVTSGFLDRLTSCAGFSEALRAVGWLSGRDASLSFPGYAAHNGETAKARASAAKRQEKSRKSANKRHGESVTNVTHSPLPEERRGDKKKDSTPLPPPDPKPDKPLVSLETALGYAPMARMSPRAVEHWWHTRNAAGWTRSTASGGHPRRITSWQSDMTASRDWAEEAAAKAPTGSTPKPSRCL